MPIRVQLIGVFLPARLGLLSMSGLFIQNQYHANGFTTRVSARVFKLALSAMRGGARRTVRNNMQSNRQSQRGYTLLQGLAILAVIGIVLTLFLNYLR